MGMARYLSMLRGRDWPEMIPWCTSFAILSSTFRTSPGTEVA